MTTQSTPAPAAQAPTLPVKLLLMRKSSHVARWKGADDTLRRAYECVKACETIARSDTFCGGTSVKELQSIARAALTATNEHAQ